MENIGVKGFEAFEIKVDTIILIKLVVTWLANTTPSKHLGKCTLRE